jgi:uncharacterized protein (DUF885 family)
MPRFCIAALVFVVVAGAAQAQDTASQRLERLAAEAQERVLDLFPTGEVFSRGAGPRQDRLELTFTPEHRARQAAHQRWLLGELARIPAGELNPSEQISHRLLAYRAEQWLESLQYPFPQHYLLIHLDGGVAFNLIQLTSRQPFRNEPDYQAWSRRLQQYPAFLDGVAGVLREGIQGGLTLPRPIVERTLAQLEALAPEERAIEKSALWGPMKRFPASIGEQERARIEAAYRQQLLGEMFPAIRRLAAFVRGEYLPKARASDGLGAVPRGEAMYRLEARGGTTTDLDPLEIHDLGLREVKRIQQRLLAAGQKAGFPGPVGDLRRWLRGQPGLYPFTTGEQVIAHLNAIHARIVPQLPKLFGRLPKTRLEIRTTDPAIAATTPAQWYPPSDDGSRPGVFAMPVVDARQVSTFNLASLLAHEGMPGHHLEGALKIESRLPEFRRRTWFTAYGEGWALYAESLGHDLGLYDDPVALMGRYQDELYRAGRLVVDTGLHARGWTRQQAVRYMVDECGASEDNANLEVVRYMAWPGQALGYKIGELTLLDIRAQAEKRLGVRFDIRAFHDAIIEEGQLPLSMLRARMESWIAAREK